MLAALTQYSPDEDQDPLLRLYWNRAGVKRELVRLKRDHYSLLEKMEQQESEILRAQNQLEGLERLLTDPLAAANAMVYFQLRHMWRVGTIKIEQFSRELTAQREKRERAQLHSTIMAKRNRRLQAINAKLDELLQKRKTAIEECLRYEQRLERMNFIVRLFAGHSVRNRIQGFRSNRSALEERINEFNDIVEKIQGEPLPDPDGLTLESQRLINVAVIALAQHLVAHFVEHDLARLARKANQRSVADMKFGDRRTCDRMVEHIRERVDQLNADKRLADQVKTRADYLMNQVRYNHETDSVPMKESLATIKTGMTELASQPEATISVNVLEADFWDIGDSLR